MRNFLENSMSEIEKQKKNESYIVRFMQHKPTALYDIGVGPKTEWRTLSEIFPQMSVHGVEANPELIDFLLKSNWIGQLLNNAVTQKIGKTEIKIFSEELLDSSILNLKSRNQIRKHDVDCISLDEADLAFNKQSQILLWMDIEGSELDALKSGFSLLRSGRVRWINLEVREVPSWEGGCSSSEIDEFLVGAGFKKVASYNHHPKSGHWDSIYFHIDEPVTASPTYRDVPIKSRS